MTALRLSAVCLGAAVFLAGCGYMDNVLWPSLTGEEPTGVTKQKIEIKAAEPDKLAAPVIQIHPQAAQLPTSSSLFGPALPTPQPTATYLRKKLAALYADLHTLQD